jgi:hypothetical protein
VLGLRVLSEGKQKVGDGPLGGVEIDRHPAPDDPQRRPMIDRGFQALGQSGDRHGVSSGVLDGAPGRLAVPGKPETSLAGTRVLRSCLRDSKL